MAREKELRDTQWLKEKETGVRYFYIQCSLLGLKTPVQPLDLNDYPMRTVSTPPPNVSMRTVGSMSPMDIDTSIVNMSQPSKQQMQQLNVDNIVLAPQTQTFTTGSPKTPPFKSTKVEPVPVVTFCQMATRYRPRWFSNRKISSGLITSPKTIPVSKTSIFEAENQSGICPWVIYITQSNPQNKD